jgi:plastocyanin
MSHTVTGDNGGPSSQPLATGQSYSFTFNTAGTFAYHCSIHPSMTGMVIVTP